MIQPTAASIAKARITSVASLFRLTLARFIGFNLLDVLRVVPVIDGGVLGLRIVLIDLGVDDQNDQPLNGLAKNASGFFVRYRVVTP